MISCILFDFFDVIRADPYKKWLADNDYKREGFYYDVAADYDRGVINREDYIELLSKESGQSVEEINSAFQSANIFDDDVIALIGSLYANYKVGLVSNSGGPGLRKVMKSRDLEPLFHDIIISGEVGFIKPEREIFELALLRLDATPAESIFIDDNQHNVDAAQQLGIHGTLFTSAPKLKDDLRALNIEVNE